jgi:hypothetical protein
MEQDSLAGRGRPSQERGIVTFLDFCVVFVETCIGRVQNCLLCCLTVVCYYIGYAVLDVVTCPMTMYYTSLTVKRAQCLTLFILCGWTVWQWPGRC